MCVKLRRAKFQLSSARKHFQIGGWIERVENSIKKLAISRKQWDTAKVITDHKWEMAYVLLNEMKIIDLEWFWRSLTTSTVGYLSDSWASCYINRLFDEFYGSVLCRMGMRWVYGWRSVRWRVLNMRQWRDTPQSCLSLWQSPPVMRSSGNTSLSTVSRMFCFWFTP